VLCRRQPTPVVTLPCRALGRHPQDRQAGVLERPQHTARMGCSPLGDILEMVRPLIRQGGGAIVGGYLRKDFRDRRCGVPLPGGGVVVE